MFDNIITPPPRLQPKAGKHEESENVTNARENLGLELRGSSKSEKKVLRL